MSQILNIAVAEIDAKLRKLTHRIQEGSAGTVTLVREWIAIDARAADTLKATLAASSTALNPLADQEEYAGTWSVASVTIEGDDTRAVTLVQVLSLPSTNGVVITWQPDCATRVTRRIFFDRSLSQYGAIASTYSSSTDGVTVDISQPRTNDNGLYDVTVTLTTVQVQNFPATSTTTFANGSVVEDNPFETEAQWIQKGLTNDALMWPNSYIVGYIRNRDVTTNPDCSKTVLTRVKRLNAVSNSTVVAVRSKGETSDIVENDNQPAALVPAVAAVGTVVTSTSELNRGGFYKTRLETVAPVDLVITDNAFKASAAITSALETTHTENTDPESASAGTGEIVVVDNEPTKTGRYRTRVQTIKPANQTASGATHSAARNIEVTTETEGTEADPDVNDGQILRVENVPTEAGNFRTRVEVEIPEPQGFSVEYETVHGTASYEAKTQQPVGTAAGEAAALTDATSNDVSGHITEAGLESFSISKRPRSPESIPANDDTYWKDFNIIGKVMVKGNYKEQWTYVSYFSSMGSAQNFIDSTTSPVAMPAGWILVGWPTSTIHHLQGGRRKEAVRVWREV